MKLKREKNKIKKKLFWFKAVIGLAPFCFICTIPNSINVSNTLNVEKTNISDVFDTLPTWENLHSDPSNDEVLTYLNKYLVNSNKIQYSSVINEILITNISNGLVNIVTKPDSREYTGSYEFHYSLYNRIDISTLLNGVKIDSDFQWQNVPTRSTLLRQIHEKIPSIDINQLTVNINDITFVGGYYYANIVAVPNSNLYFGTGSVCFGLHANKHFEALGVSIWYSSTVVSTAPTLSGNKILINSNGWYCIDNIDSSTTDLRNRNITTADNTSNVRIYIGASSKWLTRGTNCFTLGNNSIVNLSIGADLSITAARNNDDDFIPAGIRVPYSSSLNITGKNANFSVCGSNGYSSAAGIGGDSCNKNEYGPKDPGTSSLTCGAVTLLGNLTMNIYGGGVIAHDCGGAGAGIGGGGCLNGYAGWCRSVTINTTGICNIYGGSSPYPSYNAYATPGCAIGGGSCGAHNEPTQSLSGVYLGGTLSRLVINSGYINCVSKSIGNSIGAASTIGGGGVCCGPWISKKNSLTLAGGGLGSFEMNGGLLVVNATSGEYKTISNQISSAIGGGGVGARNQDMTSDLASASTCKIGNMSSFVLNSGNIYVSNGSHRSNQEGLETSTYGRAGHKFEVDGIPITYGTQYDFQINNGSIFQDEVFEDAGKTFTKWPTNSNNQTLYPCLVPSIINGVSTIGKTLTIPSINYSCNLENLAEYNSSCEASGCLWLPVGNYTDIMIDGISYYAYVNSIVNPTTTVNIVRC